MLYWRYNFPLSFHSRCELNLHTLSTVQRRHLRHSPVLEANNLTLNVVWLYKERVNIKRTP